MEQYAPDVQKFPVSQDSITQVQVEKAATALESRIVESLDEDRDDVSTSCLDSGASPALDVSVLSPILEVFDSVRSNSSKETIESSGFSLLFAGRRGRINGRFDRRKKALNDSTNF